MWTAAATLLPGPAHAQHGGPGAAPGRRLPAPRGPALQHLGLRGLSVIIPHVARFQQLASLRLHYVHGDSRQPSVDGEDNFRYFLAQMGRFTCLRELSGLLPALREARPAA